jgi:hypothetical protein
MTDFTSTPGKPSDETDGSAFAATPSWDRSKKRRGFASRFGGTDRVASETRSFAPADEPPPMTLSDDARAYEARAAAGEPMDAIDPIETIDAPTGAFAVAPAYAERAAQKGSNAPLAIAAGVILLGGLAAAGWYFVQAQPPRSGVAELTPGVTNTTTATPEVASNGAAPAPGEPTAPTAAEPAATVTPPVPVRPATASPARASHPVAVARARTTARTAADEGANASSLAPALAAPAPVPPAAAPAPPLVLNIPPAPVQVSPSPTPPAEQPTTPPTQPPPT